MKVLVVEDEYELSNSIAAYLRSENYHCEMASDYSTAVSKINDFDYDCILLDITLPDGNGLQLLHELKERGKTDAVIVISARNSLEDRVFGLSLGADDYLAKPFYLSELGARVHAVIRRRRFNGKEILQLNEIKIDFGARVVYVHDEPVYLTRKEYDLLLYMVANKNRVLSKNALAVALSGIAGGGPGMSDFVYSHIKNLKKKLTVAGSNDYIKSVYGTGYKFEIRL